jgi:hypothetical protein
MLVSEYDNHIYAWKFELFHIKINIEVIAAFK